MFLKLIMTIIFNLLVIRQKDESQDVCFKKTKHVTFSEKRISNFAIELKLNVLHFLNIAGKF